MKKKKKMFIQLYSQVNKSCLNGNKAAAQSVYLKRGAGGGGGGLYLNNRGMIHMGGSTKSQKAGRLKRLEAKIVKKSASYRDYVET